MEEDELIVTCVIFIVVILIVVLFFVYRQEIFGYGIMDKETALEKGFGYFDEPVTSGCSNASGKCSEMGVQTTITNCIINPTTGKGCINSKGNQVFKPTVTHSSCVPQCRSSVWKIEAVSDCKSTEEEQYGCVTETLAGVVGYKLITKKCVENDTYGVNACVIPISEQIYLSSQAPKNIQNDTITTPTDTITTTTTPDYLTNTDTTNTTTNTDTANPINVTSVTNQITENDVKYYNPITNTVEYPSVTTVNSNNGDLVSVTTDNTVFPEGCYSDGNGQTVTCTIGASYQEMTTCDNPMYPVCGVWGYRHISPIVDSNGNYNKPSIDISPCAAITQIIPSSTCYSFETNYPMTGDENLFQSGYLPLPMGCVNRYSSTGTDELWNNWDSSNPLEVGDGSVCKPYNYTNVDILQNFIDGNDSVVENNGFPNCVVPCFYYNKPTSNYSNELLRLIGKFHVLFKDSYFLTLNNVPCPVSLDDSNFLAPGQSVNVLSNDVQPQLSDCLSNPFSVLRRTPCLFVDLSTLNYEKFVSCTNQDIVLNSAIVLTFKPTRTPTPVPTGSDGGLGSVQINTLYCRILAVLGKNYVGILSTDPSGYLQWTQKNINVTPNLSLNDVSNSEFIVSWNGYSYDIINTTTNLLVQTTNASDLNLMNVQLGSSEELSDDDKLNLLLQSRQNRLTSNCNILNTKIIPKGYTGT